MFPWRRDNPRRVFERRTQVWQEVGLGAEIDARSAARAKGKLVVLAALIAGVMVVFSHRHDLFPAPAAMCATPPPSRWSSSAGRSPGSLAGGAAPSLFRRMDPGTAGTVGFLIRLVSIVIVVVVALRLVGLSASSLAVGGAFTAVVVGLAAQQTIGNVFAGIVLQSARPFRVGERVNLRAGPLAGEMEGMVSSLGLFYVTLVDGANRIMIPNSVLLQVGDHPAARAGEGRAAGPLPGRHDPQRGAGDAQRTGPGADCAIRPTSGSRRSTATRWC